VATVVSADVGSRFALSCSSGVEPVLVLGSGVALLSVLADVAAVTSWLSSALLSCLTSSSSNCSASSFVLAFSISS